jgi:2-polyprenyl-6-methoxyphenol hydroxylase-like FAD-dependent oxidoreductase
MGVGINYAIQDAVALAARIVPELRAGSVRRETLAAVQKRRLPPVKKMQRIQAFIHERIAGPAAQGQAVIPRPVRALLRHAQPIVQRFAARLVGYGFRPEHVGRR